MSRQMGGMLPCGVEINETALKILVEIDRRTKAEGAGAIVSLERLGDAVGVSRSTTRRNCRVLEDQGLLSVNQRYSSSGGRLENEYTVTDKGHEVLAGAERIRV